MRLTEKQSEKFNELANDFNNKETRILLMKKFDNFKQSFSRITKNENPKGETFEGRHR